MLSFGIFMMFFRQIKQIEFIVKKTPLIVLLLIGLAAQAQLDSIYSEIRFGRLRFKEGLYINHNQLVTNNPIPLKYIITKYDKTDFDFYNKLLSEESIVYFDAFGLKKELKVDDLWGFCRRGSIYINAGDDFNRIPIVGSICHFAASVTVYEDNRYNVPYGYTNNYSYYNEPTSSSRTEIYQFMMDFNSGKILEYTTDNVEVILKSDPELYNEFKALRKKKQKQQKFLYIRKYNEKYPLQIEASVLD